MAASQIQECFICAVEYNESTRIALVLKECGHTFCLECITQLKKTNATNNEVTCPTCRKVTVWKSTESLPKNFSLHEAFFSKSSASSSTASSTTTLSITCSDCSICDAEHGCLDCGDNFCSGCWEHTHRHKRFASHVRGPVSDFSRMLCERHPSEVLTHVCMETSCAKMGEMICHRCRDLPVHLNHSVSSFEKCGEECSTMLKRSKDQLEVYIPRLAEYKRIFEDHEVHWINSTELKRQRDVASAQEPFEIQIREIKRKRDIAVKEVVDRSAKDRETFANSKQEMIIAYDSAMKLLQTIDGMIECTDQRQVITDYMHTKSTLAQLHDIKPREETLKTVLSFFPTAWTFTLSNFASMSDKNVRLGSQIRAMQYGVPVFVKSCSQDIKDEGVMLSLYVGIHGIKGTTYSFDCYVNVDITLVNFIDTSRDITKNLRYHLNADGSDRGFNDFALFASIADESSGFVRNDEITVRLTFNAIMPSKSLADHCQQFFALQLQ